MRFIDVTKTFITFLRKKRFYTRTLFFILDITIIYFSWLFSLAVNYDYLNYELLPRLNWIIIFYFLIIIPVYFLTGQYKGISSYLGTSSFINIISRNIFVFFIVFIIGKINQFTFPEKSFFIVFGFFLINTKILLRILIRDYLLNISYDVVKKPNVAIYGAGQAGALLASSINLSRSHKIKFFIDDNEELQTRDIDGIRIIDSKNIRNYLNKIDQILIAMPSITNEKKLKIIKKLQKFNIKILQIPSLLEISKGEVNITELKPIAIEDLLSRDEVFFKKDQFEEIINKKIICVLGAGGSIGSEICRQIIQYRPKKLILIDNHEYSLYQIDKELNNSFHDGIEIISYLCDVKEKKFMEEIILKDKIEIIFHAAAYKHVPLVERNPIQGISNNLFTTKTICEAAKNGEIKNLILISSDKAVRPTNIMGASKRLSELIVQYYSKIPSKTIFSMVRFGNVLGSSGSVVPLFKEQINTGGPITITDKKIVRYFMTISEAAQLVIQTVTYSKGGEVFLLDMGKPVKILELAKQMIQLSGLTERNKKNPNGNIEIKTTGLRPGEKLFEELLINANSEPTPHPLIFKGLEKTIPIGELKELLNLIEITLRNNNQIETLKLLKKLVPEWRSEVNQN